MSKRFLHNYTSVSFFFQLKTNEHNFRLRKPKKMTLDFIFLVEKDPKSLHLEIRNPYQSWELRKNTFR